MKPTYEKCKTCINRYVEDRCFRCIYNYNLDNMSYREKKELSNQYSQDNDKINCK